jgi:hypothetical protein
MGHREELIARSKTFLSEVKDMTPGSGGSIGSMAKIVHYTRTWRAASNLESKKVGLPTLR